MKENNAMMWAVAAAAAWFLWRQGALDRESDFIGDIFSRGGEVAVEGIWGEELVVNGNGETVVDIISGNGADGESYVSLPPGGVGGITDWGDIYA